jgi:hypothetical protein
MKARVGDRLVKDGGDGRRVCEIIGLHHADGSPPYVVRWLSDGHIALLYPGPYMRLVHADGGPPADGPAAGAAGRAASTGQAAAGEPPASREHAGEAGRDRRAGGRAKAARMPGAGRRWQANPFAPRALAAPWPSRGAT